MINCYAFDVDETLEFSGGPVTWTSVQNLRVYGHAVGLCGNWGRSFGIGSFRKLQQVNFVGPMSMTKAEFLLQIRTYAPGFDDYVMVGNDPRVKGESQDAEAARLAGWRFISEDNFADGAR